MELGEPDASGRRRPVEVPGSEFTLDVDCVIIAIGTSPNPLIKSTTKGLEVNNRGGIIVNEDGLTSREGVYAGGDAVTGAATVILRHGRRQSGRQGRSTSISWAKPNKLVRSKQRQRETSMESLFFVHRKCPRRKSREQI